MPSRASPSLGSWLSLNITLGCLGHPQSQALATPYSIVHQILTQNLKLHNTKLNRKSHKLRQYKKINHHFWYCCELILYLLVWHNHPCCTHLLRETHMIQNVLEYSMCFTYIFSAIQFLLQCFNYMFQSTVVDLFYRNYCSLMIHLYYFESPRKQHGNLL